MGYDDDDDKIMNLRASWTFSYKPAEVLDAAEKMAKHHGERIKWWQQEVVKAEDALKEKGFEYRERHNTMGSDIQIVGDPELARRVTECKDKIRRHTDEEMIYKTWIRALGGKAKRQPDSQLELKITDVLFFGL